MYAHNKEAAVFMHLYMHSIYSLLESALALLISALYNWHALLRLINLVALVVFSLDCFLNSADCCQPIN